MLHHPDIPWGTGSARGAHPKEPAGASAVTAQQFDGFFTRGKEPIRIGPAGTRDGSHVPRCERGAGSVTEGKHK